MKGWLLAWDPRLSAKEAAGASSRRYFRFQHVFRFFVFATSLWTFYQHVQHFRPENVAAIVDDRLFFCSGNYTFDDDGLPRHTTSSIYWMYLNDTIDVSGPLDIALLGSTVLPSESLIGGKNLDPGGSAGTFFYDHTTLYPYAGLISFGSNGEGVCASDPRTGTSFYTGGWTLAYNGTYNGTVKFRSSADNNPQWNFETFYAGMQGPNILKGSMVYVRKGQEGILIAFGGTWYHQTATGDLPDLRTEFCVAVSSTPDDSSFQITIHGGWDQLNRRAFNDVYVLSVPSFRWIKVEDSDNPDLRGPDQPGRNRHKCGMWNETSMFVTSSEIMLGVGDTSLLAEMCNPAYPPVKALDTSTCKWQTEFNPSMTYLVPEVVTGVIGGDSSGGAQVTKPELSSSNPESPSHSEESSDSTKGHNSNGFNNGTIAGIVVGGVAAIASIAGILWAVFSRHSSRRREEKYEDPPNITHVPLVKGWHKPELDATTSQRYELDVEHIVHEVHGEDVGKWTKILHGQQRNVSPTSLPSR
ncbi:hypothetical protein F4782DRAFT_532118 [Xylaria castorea]|nr:hypothetical protein F4782DRAFT_532118 [Xylaria castorea]